MRVFVWEIDSEERERRQTERETERKRETSVWRWVIIALKAAISYPTDRKKISCTWLTVSQRELPRKQRKCYPMYPRYMKCASSYFLTFVLKFPALIFFFGSVAFGIYTASPCQCDIKRITPFNAVCGTRRHERRRNEVGREGRDRAGRDSRKGGDGARREQDIAKGRAGGGRWQGRGEGRRRAGEEINCADSLGTQPLPPCGGL